MLNNLAINQNTGDLLELENQIQQVTGLDAIAQAIYSDLKTFLGEYWLNREIGVPYIQVIFVKSTDFSISKTILKDAILNREEVIEVTEFEAEFIGNERKLSIVFSAKTTEGFIENQEVLI